MGGAYIPKDWIKTDIIQNKLNGALFGGSTYIPSGEEVYLRQTLYTYSEIIYYVCTLSAVKRIDYYAGEFTVSIAGTSFFTLKDYLNKITISEYSDFYVYTTTEGIPVILGYIYVYTNNGITYYDTDYYLVLTARAYYD